MPSPSLLTNGGVYTYADRDAVNALISGQGLLTQGNVFWVRPTNGSDVNDGKSPASAFQTLGAALAACVANQNDVVLLCAEGNAAGVTTASLSANLNWSKDLVHLIGVNGAPFIGQRSRISNSATVPAFANLFTVSANGCRIQNIEFFQGAGSTNPSAASTCVTVSGQRNHFVNCQISGIGDTTLDDAGSNSLTLSGSENTFEGCYIGLDTIIRATSVTEVVISAGARNTFLNCHFETYTSGSTFKMVSINAACDRFIKFKNCEFLAVQNISSAVAPTGLIGITTMNGQVLMTGCTLYGFAQYTTADNAYVQMLGLDGTATGHLIGITQGVDAA